MSPLKIVHTRVARRRFLLTEPSSYPLLGIDIATKYVTFLLTQRSHANEEKGEISVEIPSAMCILNFEEKSEQVTATQQTYTHTHKERRIHRQVLSENPFEEQEQEPEEDGIEAQAG